MIGLILLPILTRVFAPAEYGATELIGLLLLFISYFVVVGNDSALLRFVFDTNSAREQGSDRFPGAHLPGERVGAPGPGDPVAVQRILLPA